MKKLLVFSVLTGSLIAPMSASALNMSMGEKEILRSDFTAAAPKYVSSHRIRTFDLFESGLDAPGSCSDGDVGLTVIEGFKDGRLKQAWSQTGSVLKELVSSSGLVYLSALFVEKSNPNLYQFLTEGIFVGMDDFLSGMRSCEALADTLLATGTMGEAATAAKVNSIEDKAGNFSGNMAKYREEVAESAPDGVKWFFGNDSRGRSSSSAGELKAGGETSRPIEVVSDSVVIGSCISRGVKASDCNEDVETEVPVEDDDMVSPYNQMLEVTFGEKVEDIEKVAKEILGEKSIRICEGCDTVSKEGRGSQVFLDKHKEKIYAGLMDVYYKDPKRISANDYLQVSAPGSIEVGYSHMRGLQLVEGDQEVKQIYGVGLAFDVAYARTIFALDEIERSLGLAVVTDIAEKSGMREEIRWYLKLIADERDRLERHYKERGYVPQTYARKLLSLAVNASPSR